MVSFPCNQCMRIFMSGMSIGRTLIRSILSTLSRGLKTKTRHSAVSRPFPMAKVFELYMFRLKCLQQLDDNENTNHEVLNCDSCRGWYFHCVSFCCCTR